MSDYIVLDFDIYGGSRTTTSLQSPRISRCMRYAVRPSGQLSYRAVPRSDLFLKVIFTYMRYVLSSISTSEK